MRQINILINDITTDSDKDFGTKRLRAHLGTYREMLIPKSAFYQGGSIDILARYKYQLANDCLRGNIDIGNFEQQFDLFKRKLSYMVKNEYAGDAFKIIDELREDLKIDFKIVENDKETK